MFIQASPIAPGSLDQSFGPVVTLGAGSFQWVKYDTVQDEYIEYARVYMNGAMVYSVGNVSAAVPEPASWAMLIAGFGLVGAAARRNRAAVSVRA